MTAPRILVVDGGVPAGHRPHAGGEVDLAPCRAFGALAEGTSVVHGLSDGADVAASLAAVEAMGVGVERRTDGTVVLHGGRGRLHQPGPRSTAGIRARPCGC